MRNPHREPRVDVAARARAIPAAVLIPIVVREPGLGVLLTRRHEQISHPGHICFPGGRWDPEDADAEGAALREAQEEIALQPSDVRVIGRLGEYFTHSGFCIHPVVGLIDPLLGLAPRAGEVEEILEVPLDYLLDSETYRLRAVGSSEERAHYFVEHRGAYIAGPTVSLLMGFYEELLWSHPPV